MLEEKLTGRVARFADRREDWSVFGFETARYARAQRRYLGASGNRRRSGLPSPVDRAGAGCRREARYSWLFVSGVIWACGDYAR